MSLSSNGGDGPESTTGSISERKREQKRVSLACQVCKKRKIRCDGTVSLREDPEGCENCKNFGSECEYVGSGVKRGPQKGYKLKRKRSILPGELEDDEPQGQYQYQDQRHLESRSPVTGPPNGDSLSRSPAVDSSLNPNPTTQETPVTNAPEFSPQQSQRSPSSPSPPLSSRHWTAAHTNEQDVRTIAPLPSHEPSHSRNEQRRDAHGSSHVQPNGNGNRLTSPNMESAIRALESLSEVRHHPRQQYPSSSSVDDHRTSVVQNNPRPSHQPISRHGTVRSNEPQGRALPSTMMPSAAFPTILSVPASSNNSDDGMTDGIRCLDQNSLEHESLESVRLDKHTRDRLLAVYWTHIHNVWPLLYKPEFYASTAHKPLLLAMLAAAAAIPTPGKSIVNASQADQLFEQARDAVLIRRRKVHVAGPTTAGERAPAGAGQQDLHYEIAPATSSLQTVQCMILFSLRQTSNGNKSSAYLWFCHAAAMALELGLHRVVLDKSKHIPQCLDLDNELFLSSSTSSSSRNESRQLVVMDDEALQEELARVEKQKAQLARKLTDWWEQLDPDLRVDFQAKICPPIHFVVNCCWYYSATIFLHSKNIGTRGIIGSRSEVYQTSHRICSEAAGNIVTLLGYLDRFKILAPASSDIIHMLSHAALFHAYNAAIPNNEFAASAEANFQQCCLWLQEIGSFWAPASVQRQFFEGLVKGGKELTAKTRPTTQGDSRNSAPLSGLSVDVTTPSQLLRQSPSQSTSFLRPPQAVMSTVGEQSAAYNSNPSVPNMLNVPDSSDIFRVRSHFWNEFLPNAEQFNADRRESDLGSFTNSLSEDLGSLYDLTSVAPGNPSRFTGPQAVMTGEDMSLAAIASLTQGPSAVYPLHVPTNGGDNPGSLGNVDPSDWLVTYMLDSLQQNKS
ncbi:hypothetical protein QFC19_001312 [Naganishia cerealis]|uniref:Uncharacterized protein n=1 Tax=Naganishia cerealis TaxID=610337 RepID=A0ACC2WH84_9TREE|nr:hypothetical protein QFC19_001312 [Naganishia cerealis]